MIYANKKKNLVDSLLVSCFFFSFKDFRYNFVLHPHFYTIEFNTVAPQSLVSQGAYMVKIYDSKLLYIT